MLYAHYAHPFQTLPVHSSPSHTKFMGGILLVTIQNYTPKLTYRNASHLTRQLSRPTYLQACTIAAPCRILCTVHGAINQHGVRPAACRRRGGGRRVRPVPPPLRPCAATFRSMINEHQFNEIAHASIVGHMFNIICRASEPVEISSPALTLHRSPVDPAPSSPSRR